MNLVQQTTSGAPAAANAISLPLPTAVLLPWPQQRAVDGLKLLKKQRVNTKVLGATQAGKRIKALAKHSKPDVAAAATAVIAAWKDAVRQEAADSTAAIAGDGTAAASTASAGGPASSRQTAPSSSGPGDGGGGTQPSSQQTVDAAAPAQLPSALDPEAVPRSGDSVRDKCRQHLASAFQQAVMEGVAGDPVMAAVAVENEIFNQNNGVSQVCGPVKCCCAEDRRVPVLCFILQPHPVVLPSLLWPAFQ